MPARCPPATRPDPRRFSHSLSATTRGPNAPAPSRWSPVFRRLTADALTPVAAYQKLRRGGRGFLFESVVGGEKVGRYSFCGVRTRS